MSRLPSITERPSCHSDLSERLNLSKDEGEKWIVNLIRETRMGADAKIDLEKVCTFANKQLAYVLLTMHAECYRDQPTGTPSVPNCYRENARTCIPHASSWRSDVADTAGAAVRCPRGGATCACRGRAVSTGPVVL